MRRLVATPALLGLGLALLGLTLAGLALHVPGADSVGTPARTDVFVALLALAGIAYLLAVRHVLRRPDRSVGPGWVLLVALGLRLAVLTAPPFLSSDVYRYVWDGRVQQAGINPYRYIPADPALASLRDPAIYARVNRRDYARTIYPPMAQLVFRLVAGLRQTPLAMRLAMVASEAVGMLAMLALLARAGLPSQRLLVYAWNPLAVWAFAGNGHVDGLAVGFLGLALLARAGRRDGWAGLALGAAVLVKFLPAAIAPALWRRWDWRMPAACVLLIAALYGLYAGAGWHVLGFLPSYTTEEGLDQGSGFWLLAGLERLGQLPRLAAPAYLAASLCGLLGLAAWVGLRLAPRRDAAEGPEAMVRVAGLAATLAAALILVISPHYPWYFPSLGLFCCLCPLPAVIWLSVAPLVLYLDPLHERFLWPGIVYAPTLLLAARSLAASRRRGPAVPTDDQGRVPPPRRP